MVERFIILLFVKSFEFSFALFEDWWVLIVLCNSYGIGCFSCSV